MSRDVLKEVEEMVHKEVEYAKELDELSNMIDHPVLQALFKAIAFDSRKHSVLYTSALRLLREEIKALTEEELKIISEKVRKHIELEKEMIERTLELMKQTDDPKLKLILASIHEDEVKHHKLLTDIEKNIASKYGVTEEELWDMIWKDSPWHGTPGG